MKDMPYKVRLHCNNCGQFIDITISYGITVKEYLIAEEKPCPHCGCGDLYKMFVYGL